MHRVIETRLKDSDDSRLASTDTASLVNISDHQKTANNTRPVMAAHRCMQLIPY